MIEIQRNKEVLCFVVLYSRKDGRDGYENICHGFFVVKITQKMWFEIKREKGRKNEKEKSIEFSNGIDHFTDCFFGLYGCEKYQRWK